MGPRRCPVCGVEGEFYRHVASRCKECHKAAMRARHREKMADGAWLEAERKRSREKFRKAGARWKKADPRHRAANTAVGNAVRDGRLVPADACEDCGHDFSEYRREGHHNDYGKPLDVEWLCALCHGKRHRKDIAA